MTEEQRYDAFVNGLKEKYPEMYHNVYCGISINEGWYKIVESLSAIMYHEVKYNNERREKLLKDNKYNQEIPDELEFPEVHQIKEKFGGLRFYADKMSKHAQGALRMAEAMAEHTCEYCGEPGEMRHGGWIKVLCDKHEAERQERMKERFGDGE